MTCRSTCDFAGRTSVVLFVSLMLLMAGCKSTEETPEPGPAPPEEQPLPTPAEEEPEEEEPPPEEREPATRTVQGFRIQIAMTPEQSVADDQYEEALAWWNDVPRSQRPRYMRSNDVPLKIEWKAPYYRVRLGAFASRDEARGAMDLVRRRFPDAFLVPDTVTLTRMW